MSQNGAPAATDEGVGTPTQDHLARNREAQFLAALYARLRERPRPWWSAQTLRELFPTSTRFQWLDKRPDVRERIAHALTGFPIKALRTSDVAFQTTLVERVVESGDVSPEAWEAAFDPADLVAAGPPAALWTAFRARFPWDTPAREDQDLLVWLLNELLDEKKDGNRTSSIMTPLYVRSAIDVRAWQEHIPLEIRVQVDGRRLRKELEGKTFTCRDELAVVKVERIVEHLPAAHLKGILDALERVVPALVGHTGDTKPLNHGMDHAHGTPNGQSDRGDHGTPG
jgi:hypothetical protein